jgi:hypothetical protein
MRATVQLLLTEARLRVELHQDESLDYLYVRSLLDPAQVYLLPLPEPPAIEGLALTTTIGRLHEVPWALAYGSGRLPEHSVVHFSTDTLRWRRTVKAEPRQLGERCWVAALEGAFASAATVTAGVETARVQLSTRW